MLSDQFIKQLFDRATAEGFEDCEAYYASGDQFEAGIFEGAVISYNVSSSIGLGFRGLINGKMGYASTQVLDDDAIEMLVSSARTNAGLIENEDVQFIFEGSAEYAKLDLYNPEIDTIPAADKLDMGLQLEKATLGIDKRVKQVEELSVFSSSGKRRIVNTKGLDVSFEENGIGLYTIPVAKEEDRVNTGMKFAFARDRRELNIEKTANEAVEEAVRGLHGAPVSSGIYRIVLRRDAAASLLGAFSSVFSADAAQKGLSLLAGREGESIASDSVTLLDDPLDVRGLSAAPFDAEGVAAYRKAVIEKGQLKTLLHNLKTAHKQGVQTTGNAAKGSYAAPVSVAPTNFYFEPGTCSFDELLNSAGNGLLITELNGLHAGANIISGDFSLSAKGSRIVDGKVAEAVNQITLAGNFYQVLKSIELVSDDLEFGFPGVSCIGSPSMLICSLSVAGA